jgi:hypothetical protein
MAAPAALLHGRLLTTALAVPPQNLYNTSGGCHPNCTRRGNCHQQDGRCECPFGLAGEWCQELLIPACRLRNMSLDESEAEGHSLLLTCAQASRRNCECSRWGGTGPAASLLSSLPVAGSTA